MDVFKLGFSYEGKRVEFSIELDLRYRHDQWIAHNCKGVYEPEILQVFLHVLKPGDVAIDVGANIGFHTCFMSNIVGPKGRVIALEPVPENRNRLERNIELNKLSNVTVIPQPAWSKPEIVKIYKSIDDLSSSATGWNPGTWVDNPLTAAANPEPLPMRAITLDSLGVTPSLVKIDTEGGDFHILNGAKKMLSKGPVVVSELNPFGMKQLGYTDEQFRFFMRTYDYDLFHLHETDNLPTMVPTEVKVKYGNGVGIRNVMFARVGTIHRYWPEN